MRLASIRHAFLWVALVSLLTASGARGYAMTAPGSRSPQKSWSFALASRLAALGAQGAARLATAAATLDSAELARRGASPLPAAAAGIDFAQARGRSLTPAQIDAYIDSSITGPARDFVRDAMAEMPRSERRNFEMTDGEHDFANTAAGLAELRAQHCFSWDGAACDAGDGVTLYAPPREPSEIEAGTGFYYKFTQSTASVPFSAARGYVSLPQCSTLDDPALGILTGTHGRWADTRYYQAGGTSPDGLEELDAGVQINQNSLTVSPYLADFYAGVTTILTGTPALKIPCDPGDANVNPQHYLLITAGVYANSTKSVHPLWYTTIQEYEPNGQPTMTNGKPVISKIGPFALRSASWTVACKKCVVKREATVAQSEPNPANPKTFLPITDTDDHTGFDMYRDVLPLLPGVPDDVRVPFGELVNWRYGTFAGGVSAFATTQYLGGRLIYYPHGQTDSPTTSGQLSNWEIMTIPTVPNAGTSGIGIFAATCQTLGKTPLPILCATSVNGHIYQGR